jgi:ornithine cyclodeaminase/alanine dehydrogenase-like protein (mu-crystallin family)
MALTILTDADVKLLLHSLTRDDIIRIQQSLGDAMHYYSVGDEPIRATSSTSCAAGYQADRVSIKRKDGSTTLFMPGATQEGIGIKVVTLSETKEGGNLPTLDALTESSRSSLSNLSLTSSGSPRNSISTQGSAGTGVKTPSIVASTSGSTGSAPSSTSPAGSLTLLDPTGRTRALINASEITAFRTALASTMLFLIRENVHDVVIFGAGKQAYWHARIALLLRGPDIHHLNIINRSFDNARLMLSSLFGSGAGEANWPVQISNFPKREIVTPMHTEYSRLLRNLVRSASVMFFTTPSTAPLFPHELLTNTEGRRKGRYLAAVGSYKPHMCEIPPEVIRQAVASQSHDSGHRHFHRHATQGGAVVVDSVENCLREAGELIQAGIGGKEVVELGELIMLKREAEQRKAQKGDSASTSTSESEGTKWGLKKKKQSGSSTSLSKEEEEDTGVKDWLRRGNVIYKSVGLALMVRLLSSTVLKLT